MSHGRFTDICTKGTYLDKYINERSTATIRTLMIQNDYEYHVKTF